MFFLIGMIATIIMLLLLPHNSFYRNRKVTASFILTYSLMYFFIIQYGLTLKNLFEVPVFLAAAVLILYLTIADRYINKTLGLNEFLRIVLFVLGPILIAVWFQPDNNQSHLIDMAVLILIFAMVDSGCINVVPLVYKENTIEFYSLPITTSLLVLLVFLGYRHVDINLFWHASIDVWAITLMVCFLCVLFTLVTGLHLKYLAFNNTEKPGLRKFMILAIFNFLHVAIYEEIVYRGFIYSYLQNLTGEAWISLILTTLFFGYQHIAYAGKRMCVLAIIAGFFYGLAYILTGNLLCAAIVHTVTNIVWRSYFVLIPEQSKAEA